MGQFTKSVGNLAFMKIAFRAAVALIVVSTPAMAEGNLLKDLFDQGVDGIKSIRERFIKEQPKSEPSPTPEATPAPSVPTATPEPAPVATSSPNALLDQVEQLKSQSQQPSPQQAEEMENALLEIHANGESLIGKSIEFSAYILSSPGMIGDSVMLTSTWPHISNGTFADYSKLSADQKRTLLGNQGKIVHLRGTIRRANDGEVGQYIADLKGASLTEIEADAQPVDVPKTTLTGTLQKLLKGEDTYYVLQLDQPVTGKDENGQTITADHLQIVGLDQGQWKKADGSIGKSVQITGRAMLPETRHHHTKLLIVAEDLKFLETSATTSQQAISKDDEVVPVKQPKTRTLKTLSASDQKIFWKVIKKISVQIDNGQIAEASQTLNSIPDILQYEPMVVAGWAFVNYRRGNIEHARGLVREVYASPYCTDQEKSFLKREFAKEEKRISPN